MAKKTWSETKRSINEILNSPTPIKKVNHIPVSESDFTYDNGVRASVSTIFVDIVRSTDLFKLGKDVRLAKIIRAFVQEIIEIIRNNSHYREIGIRGDCVYAIFDTPSPADCKDVFVTAYSLHSFLMLLEKQVFEKYQINLTAGIGLGYDSESLIVKTGKSKSGIFDYVWLGDAVVDASNLSSIASRNGRKKIVMTKKFYDYSKDELLKHNNKFIGWLTSFRTGNQLCYECNIYDSSVEEVLK